MNYKNFNNKYLTFILLTFVVIIFNSCKKDVNTIEKINPLLSARNIEYGKTPRITTINLQQFKAKVKPDLLGSLKSAFTTQESNQRLMSINIPETYAGFSLYTDSIKVINGSEFTSYIFAVKPLYKRSVTFQNLTIYQNNNSISAFITTYTPSKKWIRDWKTGKAGKFEGEISITPLNIDGSQPLTFLNNQSVLKEKTMSSTYPLSKLANLPPDCSIYTFYHDEPYKCSSGLHWPWENECALFGIDGAGYVTVSSTVTICTGNPGGGSTTPDPPPGYEPCSETPGPINFNGIRGERFASIPIANPCDLEDDLEVKNQVVEPCLHGMVNNILLGDIENDISKMIDSLFGNQSDMDLIIRDNIPLAPHIDGEAYPTINAAGKIGAMIFLNREFLKGASREYIAATIMHEALHTYMGYYGIIMNAAHEEMAEKYVDTMGDILKEMFQLTDNDAKSLAWGGLTGTIFYNNPPLGLHKPQNVDTVNSNHRSGISGSICPRVGP